MPPAARVTDMHTCPMFTGPVPHVGGPILPPGAPTVLINFLPAATVTSMATCVGPPDTIVKGSTGVFINFLPAARMGDLTAHGGVIVLGSPNVLIGEIGAPSPGAGGLGGIVAGLVQSGVLTPIKPIAAVYSQPATRGSSTSASSAAHATTAAAAAAAKTAAPFPCKSAWADTVAHTNSVADMQDPMARNKLISADYARMYQQDPDLKWAGLGAIVSRQAGCAMQQAQNVEDSANQHIQAVNEASRWSPQPMSDPVSLAQSASASQARSALADTNQLIYRTVSPTMSFVAQHGAKQMQSCLKSGDIATKDTTSDLAVPNNKVDNTAVSPQLASAVDSLAAGDSARAGDKIAQFEQQNVVQDRIYNNSGTKAVFWLDQQAAKTSLGRSLGAQAPELPLSATCSGTPVPFSGSINNAADRISYYKTLSSQFETNGSQWQQSTMQQIVDQGH